MSESKNMHEKMQSKLIKFSTPTELPENIQYLYINASQYLTLTKEQRDELVKILERHDAVGEKINKLYSDWFNKAVKNI
jgi:hypothetical protein